MKWLDTSGELEYILNIGPAIVFKFGSRPGVPVEYISNNIIQFGYSAEEFNGSRYDFENIIYRDDLEYVRKQFAHYAQIQDAPGFTIIYRIYTKFGTIRWVEQRTFIIRDKNGGVDYYQGLLFDVTDRRKSEDETALNIARQEVLLNLKKMGGQSFHEIIDYAREEAVRLTKSKVGYIAFPTPDEYTLIMHSWSKNSVKECSIDKQSWTHVYPVHRTGLWGEAIRQRKSLIINDYNSPSSLKKGFPTGHVSLYRYMHVPIFYGDRIVILIGVGNKETDYDESDVLHLTLLMHDLWELIQKKRMEEALKERSAELSDHYNKLHSRFMVSREFLDDVQLKIDQYDDTKSSGPYLKLMENEVFLMSYEQQERVIEEGLLLANRMQHLIDAMRYLNMGSSGLPSSKFEIVDFKNLFERVALNTILLLRNKNIVLERHFPSAYPPVIGSDEGLDMVFTTLIENACLNSPVGGKIILEGRVIGGFFEIRIIDFGPDLDEASLPYLFQSIIFVDSGHVYSNHLEGAESGLYVAKIITQEHGGFISGARNPKGGSIYIVELPVASDKEIKTCFTQKAGAESKQKKDAEMERKTDMWGERKTDAADLNKKAPEGMHIFQNTASSKYKEEEAAKNKAANRIEDHAGNRIENHAGNRIGDRAGGRAGSRTEDRAENQNDASSDSQGACQKILSQLHRNKGRDFKRQQN